ncbi:phosphatidylinositol-4-phosphate 5-Kinase, partial [Toxoplasma gondii RUB]
SVDSPLKGDRRGRGFFPLFVFSPSRCGRRAISCEVLKKADMVQKEREKKKKEGEGKRDCRSLPGLPRIDGLAEKDRRQRRELSASALMLETSLENVRDLGLDSGALRSSHRGNFVSAPQQTDAAGKDTDDVCPLSLMNGERGANCDTIKEDEEEKQCPDPMPEGQARQHARDHKVGQSPSLLSREEQVRTFAGAHESPCASRASPASSPRFLRDISPAVSPQASSRALGQRSPQSRMDFGLPTLPGSSAPCSSTPRQIVDFASIREKCGDTLGLQTLKRLTSHIFSRVVDAARNDLTLQLSSQNALLSALHPVGCQGPCVFPVAQSSTSSPFRRCSSAHQEDRGSFVSSSTCAPPSSVEGAHGVWVRARESDVGSIIAHALLSVSMQRAMAVRWASWATRPRRESRASGRDLSERTQTGPPRIQPRDGCQSSLKGEASSVASRVRTHPGSLVPVEDTSVGSEGRRAREATGEKKEETRKLRLPCCGASCGGCRHRCRSPPSSGSAPAPKDCPAEPVETRQAGDETGDSVECDCCRGSCPVGLARLRRLRRAEARVETVVGTRRHLWGGDCDCLRCAALDALLQLATHTPIDANGGQQRAKKRHDSRSPRGLNANRGRRFSGLKSGAFRGVGHGHSTTPGLRDQALERPEERDWNGYAAACVGEANRDNECPEGSCEFKPMKHEATNAQLFSASQTPSPPGRFLSSCFLSLPTLSERLWCFSPPVVSAPFSPLSSCVVRRMHALTGAATLEREGGDWSLHGEAGTASTQTRDKCLRPSTRQPCDPPQAHCGDDHGDSKETVVGLAIRWGMGDQREQRGRGHWHVEDRQEAKETSDGWPRAGPRSSPFPPSSSADDSFPFTFCGGCAEVSGEGEKALEETWTLLKHGVVSSAQAVPLATPKTHSASPPSSSSSACVPFSTGDGPAHCCLLRASPAALEDSQVRPLPGLLSSKAAEETAGDRREARGSWRGSAVETLRGYLRLDRAASPRLHSVEDDGTGAPKPAPRGEKGPLGWEEEELRVMREILTGPGLGSQDDGEREKEKDGRERTKGQGSFSLHDRAGDANAHIEILVKAKRETPEEDQGDGKEEPRDISCLVTVFYPTRTSAFLVLYTSRVAFSHVFSSWLSLILPAHSFTIQLWQYVVKQLNRHEMRLWLSEDAGSALFRHVSETLFSEEPTTLTALYGLFQLAFPEKKTKEFYIVMENMRHMRAREDDFLSKLPSLSLLAPLASLLLPRSVPQSQEWGSRLSETCQGGWFLTENRQRESRARDVKNAKADRVLGGDGEDTQTERKKKNGDEDERTLSALGRGGTSQTCVGSRGCSECAFRLRFLHLLSSCSSPFQPAPAPTVNATFSPESSRSRLLLFDLKGVGTMRYVRLDEERVSTDPLSGAHAESDGERAQGDGAKRHGSAKEEAAPRRERTEGKDEKDEKDETDGQHRGNTKHGADSESFSKTPGCVTRSGGETRIAALRESFSWGSEGGTSADRGASPTRRNGDASDAFRAKREGNEDAMCGSRRKNERVQADARGAGLQGKSCENEDEEGSEKVCLSDGREELWGDASEARQMETQLTVECEEECQAFHKRPTVEGASPWQKATDGAERRIGDFSQEASGMPEAGERRHSSRKEADAFRPNMNGSEGGSDTRESWRAECAQGDTGANKEAGAVVWSEAAPRDSAEPCEVTSSSPVLSHPWRSSRLSPLATRPPELSEKPVRDLQRRVHAHSRSAVSSPLFPFDLTFSVSPPQPSPSAPPAAALPVLWDQNFREFSRGFPLCLESSDHAWLWRALQRDTQLLQKLDVVDYSLLVLVEEGENCRRISLALIDFFRPYTWDKQMETIGKSLAYMTRGWLDEQPTVLSPPQYRLRFLHTMAAFFGPAYPTDLTSVFASLVRTVPTLPSLARTRDRDRRPPGQAENTEGRRRWAPLGDDANGRQGDAPDKVEKCARLVNAPYSHLASNVDPRSVRSSATAHSVASPTTSVATLFASASSSGKANASREIFPQAPRPLPAEALPPSAPPESIEVSGRHPGENPGRFAEMATGEQEKAGGTREKCDGEAGNNVEGVVVGNVKRSSGKTKRQRKARNARMLRETQSATETVRMAAASAFLLLRIRDQQRKDRGTRIYD